MSKSAKSWYFEQYLEPTLLSLSQLDRPLLCWLRTGCEEWHRLADTAWHQLIQPAAQGVLDWDLQ